MSTPESSPKAVQAVSDGDMKLPLVPEEITASWLTAALGFRHRGVQVLSASVEDVIRGTSTKIRVRLHYASHGAGTQLPRR